MRGKLIATVAALAVMALTAAGCGGDDDGGDETTGPPSGDPAAVVSDFYAAVADKDAPRVCELLSAEDREPEEGGTCEEQVADLVEGPFGAALGEAEVGEVIERTDETATVEVRIGKAKAEAPLVAEEGEWRLDVGEAGAP